jgi:hypothetical protein
MISKAFLEEVFSPRRKRGRKIELFLDHSLELDEE